MAERRHLTRAPITEALVDLRGHPRKALDSPAVRDRLQSALAPRYTKHEEVTTFSTQVSFGPGRPPPQTTVSSFGGHFFRSPDSKDVAQFRVDGFTYNRLSPYHDGDELIGEALRLWPLYVEVADPGDLKRIALRYINRFENLGTGEFGRLLTTPPPTPTGAPPEVESFLTRVVSVDRTDGLQVIVTQALERSIAPGIGTLTIDIDAFLLADFSTDTETIRPVLQRLRELKNDVFFGSITEEAVARCI